MNVALLLDMAADGFGERIAFGPRDTGLTFANLRRRAAGAGEVLEGFAGGAHTLALADAIGPAVPVTLFGAAWAGRTYAPLNYRLPTEALTRLVERLDRAALVAPPDLAPAANTRPSIPTIATDAWLDATARGGAGPAYPETTQWPAVLLFTSGTSAEPKAAVLQHDHLCSYVLNTNEFGSAADHECTLLAVPPFHIAGVAAILSAAYVGRRVVALPTFTAEGWLAAVRDESVSHAFVVPTMLARIVAAAEADPELTLRSLRSLAYGGSRMPAPVLERALRRFPDVGFVNAYGLTETSSTVSVLGPEDHREAAASADIASRRRLGSVGRPVDGIEVAIVTTDGAAATADHLGEIHVRGPQVSGTYIGQASHTDGDGWLGTGDLGWMDDAGYLYVTGRADDLIIRGGENLSPSEIEDVLLGHPAVAGAAVVGLPDEEWGERVGAIVVLEHGTGTNGEELFRWARERLGTLKTPEVLAFRTELPTTATGKVIRRQVRADLLDSR